jgi:hypothetical protein
VPPAANTFDVRVLQGLDVATTVPMGVLRMGGQDHHQRMSTTVSASFAVLTAAGLAYNEATGTYDYAEPKIRQAAFGAAFIERLLAEDLEDELRGRRGNNGFGNRL